VSKEYLEANNQPEPVGINEAMYSALYHYVAPSTFVDINTLLLLACRKYLGTDVGDVNTGMLKVAQTYLNGLGLYVPADFNGAVYAALDNYSAVPPGPPLNNLSLSSTTFSSASAPGTVIATITGKTAGSTLSIIPDDGKIVFNGAQTQLLVGAVPSDIGTVSYTIREVLSGSPSKNNVFEFTVNEAPAGITLRLLVVAGGGGGGGSVGGGGGAGGLRAGTMSVEAGSYPVVVGAAGAGGTGSNQGGDGGASSVFGLTAVGGGGGGGYGGFGTTGTGRSGGSGGGGGASNGGGQNPGGAGTTDQGFAGAIGNATTNQNGGGGGGAGGTPSAGTTTFGPGVSNDISGSSLPYSRGGAGGGFNIAAGTPASPLSPGDGGRGGGSSRATSDGTAGQAGIVVIRYAGAARATGGTITTVGGDTVHTFTTNGTFVLS